MITKKHNVLLTISAICGILLSLTVADICTADRFFSSTENRILAEKPYFSVSEILSGQYMKEYDTYVTDQFWERDSWILLKTRCDLALCKKEVNGVYFGKDGYLMEKHNPIDYPEELVEEKVALLEKLVDETGAKVMLVPTADNILKDKLPAYAPYYDQSQLLRLVEKRVGKQNVIDVSKILTEHREEEIYYRTDHHWTTTGAYYGYQVYGQAVGFVPRKWQSEVASGQFLGTLHSRVNMAMHPDEIRYFPETDAFINQVVYDQKRVGQSLYEPDYLQGKNQYGFFLDDNHAFVEITTKCHNGKSLFLIKDSYANCMVPMLCAHYEKIYVVDLRYLRGGLLSLWEQTNTDSDMEVLVLYNCIHFLEDFPNRL